MLSWKLEVPAFFQRVNYSPVERYALHQNFFCSLILSAAENEWINPNSFSLEKAEKIYDQMARNRGYDYVPKLRRFINEAKKDKIRVSVHPGGIKTGLYDRLSEKSDISSYMDAIKVAEIIVYLSETSELSPDEISISRMIKNS
jgi:hypothetical protein